MSRKRYLCSIHDEISEIASDLEDTLGSYLSQETLAKLKRIKTLVKEANDAGRCMEDKLRENKKTIRSLRREK